MPWSRITELVKAAVIQVLMKDGLEYEDAEQYADDVLQILHVIKN